MEDWQKKVYDALKSGKPFQFTGWRNGRANGRAFVQDLAATKYLATMKEGEVFCVASLDGLRFFTLTKFSPHESPSVTTDQLLDTPTPN